MHIIKIKKDFKIDNLTPGCYSFLNLASISFVSTSHVKSVTYFCDGMLLSGFVSLVKGVKVKRISFDFTSIADSVFKHAQENKKKIYLIGSNDNEIENFVKKIKKRYPSINVCGSRNGYISDSDIDTLLCVISRLKPDIVVAGLGAGRQEDFILQLKDILPNSILFTCGGFIRQESSANTDYYPYLVNKFKLRAFYRMYKEPHTVSRYLKLYPSNLLKLIYSRKYKIEIK